MTDLSGTLHAASAAPAAGFETTSPEERAAILGWLAGFFAAPPTAAVIAAHRRTAGRAFFDEIEAFPDLAPGLHRIRAALAVEVDDATLAAAFERVFGLLFLGIGGPGTVAPYESAHSGDGRLFQEPTAAMNRLLAAHDLAVAVGEPADHVAIEAMLLARLVETRHPDRAALAERLDGWVPGFAERLAACDPTGLFAGAADALAATVRRERALQILETRI
jgi:TorA-specific chaperone